LKLTISTLAEPSRPASPFFRAFPQELAQLIPLTETWTENVPSGAAAGENRAIATTAINAIRFMLAS
jgi:hypothetical protein